MTSYLLEASVCLAVFFLLYRLVLSKIKLLTVNRIYLLTSSLLSLVIPLINIPVGREMVLAPFSQITVGEPIITSFESDPIGYWPNPWLLVYIIGLFIAMIYTIKSAFRLYQLLQQPKVKKGQYWHIYTDQAPVSSFFHYIFLPTDFDVNAENARMVLAHEDVHLREKHSLDLLFFQLLSLVFWFNPFIYAYKKAIKLQHEFIADEAVSKNLGPQNYIQCLIGMTLKKAGLPLSHSFAQHPVEKRIKMIENLNPTKMKKLKILSPSFVVLAILLINFSCVQTKYIQLDNQGKAEEITADQYEKLLQQKAATQGVIQGIQDIDPLANSSAKLPGTIRGKVQAGQTGSPLNEVSVIRMPSRSGTVTNEEGEYLVEVAESDTSLLFRKEGYQDINVPRNRFSVINVALVKKK